MIFSFNLKNYDIFERALIKAQNMSLLRICFTLQIKEVINKVVIFLVTSNKYINLLIMVRGDYTSLIYIYNDNIKGCFYFINLQLYIIYTYIRFIYLNGHCFIYLDPYYCYQSSPSKVVVQLLSSSLLISCHRSLLFIPSHMVGVVI